MSNIGLRFSFTDGYTSFRNEKRSHIWEHPPRDGINLTIEDLDKQSSGSRFMQLKAAKLIGNISKAGSNSQALYMQLAGMTDELAGARYARIINKRSLNWERNG